MLKTCDPEIVIEVLSSKDKDGFNPLHQALLSGNTENLNIYLQMLKNCDTEIITEVLTSRNEHGFSPLNSALMSGNVENLRMYLELTKNTIPSHELYNLVMAKNTKN